MIRNRARTVMERGVSIRMCSAIPVMEASGCIVRNAREKARDGLGNVLCVMDRNRLNARLVGGKEVISCHSVVRNVTGREFVLKGGDDDAETQKKFDMACGDCRVGGCHVHPFSTTLSYSEGQGSASIV